MSCITLLAALDTHISGNIKAQEAEVGGEEEEIKNFKDCCFKTFYYNPKKIFRYLKIVDEGPKR